MSPLWYSICVAGLTIVVALSLIGFIESVRGLLELKTGGKKS